MRSRSVSGELLKLFRADFLRLKNTLLRSSSSAVLQYTLFALVTIVFIFIEYKASRFLIERILDQTFLFELRLVLIAKIINLLFILFLALLMYSNIVMGISSLFLSEENDLFHSKPLHDESIFIYRFTETFLGTSWMFVVFGMPVFMAYAHALAHPWSFIVKIIAVLTPVLLLATGFGITVAVVLILIFSPKRTQRALVIAGAILTVGLIMIFRWMRPEQLVNPVGIEEVAYYLRTLRLPELPWLPSTWASNALSSFAEYSDHNAVRPLFLLWSGGLSAVIVSLFAFKLFWWRARSRGKGGENLPKGSIKKTDRLSTPFKMGFFYRDVVLFFRDAGQWSQMIIISALIIIYVLNFKNLPYELFGFQYWMSFISVGASGLILAALLARFAFPSVSAEGQSIWILKTAPINWSKYLWTKYVVYLVPTIVLALIMNVFSLVILDASLLLFVKCITVILLISLACTALAVGMGAIYPNFNLSEPAKVAISGGGFLFMVFSIGFIVSAVFLSVFPDAVRYLSLYSPAMVRLGNIDRMVTYAAMLLLTLVTIVLPIRIGIRSLRKRG